MASNNGGDLRSDLVGIEQVGGAGGPAVLWVCGFVGVLAVTIFVGLAGPAVHGPASAAFAPVEAVGNASRAEIAPPIALVAPEAGALVEGHSVEIHRSAIKPVGTVRVILSVAGRQIAASELELGREGPFTIDLPFVAPPSATSAELVVEQVERSNNPIHRPPVRLRPPEGVRRHGVALENGRLVVRGSTPRRVSTIDVDVVGPDGTVFANHTVSPPALDGWGDLLIPTTEFRAELDLSEAAEGLPAGTPIAVGLSWQDPQTDSQDVTSFLLVVPNPRDTAP